LSGKPEREKNSKHEWSKHSSKTREEEGRRVGKRCPEAGPGPGRKGKESLYGGAATKCAGRREWTQIGGESSSSEKRSQETPSNSNWKAAGTRDIDMDHAKNGKSLLTNVGRVGSRRTSDQNRRNKKRRRRWGKYHQAPARGAGTEGDKVVK